MSFSRAQQGPFRVLVKSAWERVGDGVPFDKKKHAAHLAWYEEQLEAATGKTSTTQCNPNEDYEDAMSHFECIWGGSIKWQMKRAGGNMRRMLYTIRQRAAKFDVDEAYLEGIAQRQLKLPQRVPLEELKPEELVNVRTAIFMQLQRQGRRGQATDKPRRADSEFSEQPTGADCPF